MTFLAAREALVLAAALALGVPVCANTFLGKAPPPPEDAPLLEALEETLGSSTRMAAERRVQRLEEALRPTFASMPKGLDGGLGPEGVRYALHRLFVDRHGWFVRGLESAGEAWNSSSPADVFKGHAGDEARDLFEARLGSHGFSLHHVAVLAATLESLVHAETVERLHDSYRLVGLSHEALANKEQVDGAIDTYMLLYVLGANHSAVTQEWLAKRWKRISDIYPTWPQTQEWARGIWQEVFASDNGTAQISFGNAVRAVETMGDRYGRWQDLECRELKGSLLALEEPGTGRVRLDTFYQSALDGNWQFSESVAYLRQLGALDESDPARPSVVIPNYINSPSNCVASSKFYSVCCIDECEALLGHLETHIAAPDASPERIAELVSDLPSATVRAPRQLPRPLTEKLFEIAASHGGAVPLHGRLFAQWLHHAYPRECPYPHLSGTTKPVTPEAWAKQTGERCSAREEEMRWHVEEARRTPARVAGAAAAEELPWSGEEELFVSRPATEPRRALTHASLLRCAMLLPALLAMVRMLVRTLQAAGGSLTEAPKQKYLV